MKNKLGLIVILFILVLMAVTNTTKSDYISFVKEKYVSQAGRAVDRSFVEEIENTFNDRTTKERNCILFTIYSTNIGVDSFQIIGAFGNFVFAPKQGALLLTLGVILIAVISITLVIRSNPEERDIEGSV